MILGRSTAIRRDRWQPFGWPASVASGVIQVMLMVCMVLAADARGPTAALPAASTAGALSASTITAEMQALSLHRASTESYVWFSSRKERRVKVHGSVPSEEDRKTILGMVKANMPDLEIDDRMEVVEGTPERRIWLGAVSFALVQLGQLGRGYVHLKDARLSVDGEARSAEAYEALQGALASLPAGVTLGNITVAAPAASPFTWGAQFENGTLTLTGHVADEEAREALLRQAARLAPDTTIVDRMELASGAPEAWSAVVTAALAQVVRLEEGRVTLSDTVLAIEGVARDEQVAAAVAHALQNGLPEPFEARSDIRPHMVESPADRALKQPGAVPGDALPTPKTAGAVETGGWASWLVGGDSSRVPPNRP